MFDKILKAPLIEKGAHIWTSILKTSILSPEVQRESHKVVL